MKKRISYVLLILLIGLSCNKDQWRNGPYSGNKGANAYPLIKIAVVSDIHYTDPSLLKNNAAQGAAFQAYVAADPKLLEYSAPLFKEIMTELENEKPDILLISGDLTKDGEKIDHQKMATLLQQLTDDHIKVYVVPGNHDINNPDSKIYDGDNATATPSITASEFSSIYANCGYGNALSRDPNSLSYIAQPMPGLWILGIDDCEYYNNTTSAITAGKIKPETLQWALTWMAEAKKRNITVLGMMHHGMLEHYSAQNQIDPGYVTDNNLVIADQFMNAGVNIWFTGHYHANDITDRVNGNNTLYDIETGSPVMTPSPYRIVTIGANFKWMNIVTHHVTSIEATIPGGMSYPAYSNLWMSGHLDGYFGYLLSRPPFSLPDSVAAVTAPLLRNAFMAHFAGDEKITPEEQAKDDIIAQMAPPIGFILHSAWTDLPPADNQLQIPITSH